MKKYLVEKDEASYFISNTLFCKSCGFLRQKRNFLLCHVSYGELWDRFCLPVSDLMSAPAPLDFLKSAISDFQ
jgi:hypothetical protein